MDKPTPRGAVFIDGDRTLLRGSALLAMLGPLHRAGYVRLRTLFTSVFLQAIFTRRGFSDAELESGANLTASMFKGLSSIELEEMARERVPDIVVPRIYPQAEALLQRHRRRGRPIFIISSAPREIVGPLSLAVQADGHASTVADSDKGVYVGTVSLFMHGKAKADAVREIAERHHLDLEASYAYADLGGDAQMLELVGHPYCVNPDQALLKTAVERRWPCLRFRSQRNFALPFSGGLRRLAGRTLRHTAPRIEALSGFRR